jgi:hypothetical protein
MILTPDDAACMTAKRVAKYPVGTVIVVTQVPPGGVTTRASENVAGYNRSGIE